LTFPSRKYRSTAFLVELHDKAARQQRPILPRELNARPLADFHCFGFSQQHILEPGKDAEVNEAFRKPPESSNRNPAS
jgi:hypothetical protein